MYKIINDLDGGGNGMGRVLLSLGIVSLIIVGCFGASANQIAQGTKNSKEYVPGEVIIGFGKTININDMYSFQGHVIKEKIKDLNAAVLEVTQGSEQNFIDSVSSLSSVRYAEYNWYVYAFLIPDDPMWGQQWGPQRIHCLEAWDSGIGSTSVKIAIVDTGIDYNHPDISANYITGGHDWVNNDNDPMDDNNHGTHCAGIAAAVMNNGVGIAGVAQVNVMAEKVLNSFGQGTSDSCSNGITHAADNGAKVISMSWGSSYPDSLIEDACNYAYNTKGALLVAASGNDGQPQASYPAAYDSVIAVGAINQNDQRCSFSNYGSKLELMAPGYQILSTIRNSQYDSYDGTSMACPHVSGVAALVLSKNPGQTNVQIRQILRNSAEDLGPSGWDQEYGYGLVDARAGTTNYSLNINIDGSGTLTKNPDQQSYISGQVVTLTANPSADWYFYQWSGDLTGNENPATITMNSEKNVTAHFIYGDNPPNKPDPPSGQTSGQTQTEYTYTTSTTDPDGDQVYYFWDWGDGTTTDWTGPYNSSELASASHTWSTQGAYVIKVKAKDTKGAESGWATLNVVMPKVRTVNTPFLLLKLLFGRFLHMFPILGHLLVLY